MLSQDMVRVLSLKPLRHKREQSWAHRVPGSVLPTSCFVIKVHWSTATPFVSTLAAAALASELCPCHRDLTALTCRNVYCLALHSKGLLIGVGSALEKQALCGCLGEINSNGHCGV